MRPDRMDFQTLPHEQRKILHLLEAAEQQLEGEAAGHTGKARYKQERAPPLFHPSHEHKEKSGEALSKGFSWSQRLLGKHRQQPDMGQSSWRRNSLICR